MSHNTTNTTVNSNDTNGAAVEESHLKKFWNLLSFKRLPHSVEDLRIIVQVEMMKYHTRAAICKIQPKQSEKYLLKILVKDTKYYCARSKLLITSPEIRGVIDIIKFENMDWHVETNREGNTYLFASWQHWGML